MNLFPFTRISVFPIRQLCMGSFIISLLVVLWPSSGRAHIVKPMNLSELQKQASLIVEGKVSAQTSYWKNRVIYTVSQVQVRSCLKGKCRTKFVAVEQLGGRVGEFAMRVSGVQLLQPTRRVLLFLHTSHAKSKSQPLHRIVGLSQGLLHYVRYKNRNWLIQDRSKLLLPSSSNPNSVQHGHIRLLSPKPLLRRLKANLRRLKVN